ncbi:VOC family protein [Nakamurella sp. PAMC28650]|uniref:VOC family protein n=1 Tax=Nakamurella sp. PAMC28650 TaxID=2762325 RepID=UPI0021075889|nr:VOC family protein [Nakamurella sp. PAMC28650]
MGIVTPDLDRFRAFYETTIGLDATMVFGSGPGHARQAVLMAGDIMLHVFEVPGYDPSAQGLSDAMFERGRLDHLGFTVTDLMALTAIRDRLIAVDASSGEIRPLGPMLSLRFQDPDGLESEINCYNTAFNPSTMRNEDGIVTPEWLERARQVLHASPSTSPSCTTSETSSNCQDTSTTTRRGHE